jgi:hypothetical protein
VREKLLLWLPLRSKHRVAIEILVDLSEAKGEDGKGLSCPFGDRARSQSGWRRDTIEMD